jgi:hypothetical protein
MLRGSNLRELAVAVSISELKAFDELLDALVYPVLSLATLALA